MHTRGSFVCLAGSGGVQGDTPPRPRGTPPGPRGKHPPCGQTGRRNNITLPQTSFAGGSRFTLLRFQVQFFACQRSCGQVIQGSHQSGKSGKILKTFSSQRNKGEIGFSANIREKFSNQGTFIKTIFKPFNMSQKCLLRL